jgi:hypothetical protein
MITTKIDDVMQTAVTHASALIDRAAEARHAHHRSQSNAREKLSARAWERDLLRTSGHDAAFAKKIDADIQTHPHLWVNTRAYIHEAGELIAQDHWWAPGPSAPLTPGADRRAAEGELARLGANVYTALVLAVWDLAQRAPRAFGRVDDQVAYDRRRREVAERAATLAADVETIPSEILLGIAVTRGVAIDPRENLAVRLIDDAVAST